MRKRKVVIIGGGASGFFAAINIAQLSSKTEVLILEKTNKLLSKVKVSGGGRCNVTHACFDPKELSTNYPRGQKELLGPFHHFASGDVISWFADRNIELKIEEDGRMFPTSDSSQTIIDCFLNEAKKFGVKVHQSTEVKRVQKGKRFSIECSNKMEYEADQLVIAIGGHPKSTHYSFLEELGHKIIAPIPSLFTFNLPKHPSNKLMGLSYNVNIKLSGTAFEEYGPLLFTHWGMSGPAVLKLSSRAAALLHRKSYQFDFEISWLDDAKMFINSNRKVKGGSKLIATKPLDMPSRLWQYLLDRSGVEPTKNWADINSKELDLLQHVLSNDQYKANGKTTFKEEFVTCGGVSLKDIDLKRMQSKKVENLFFCGEVMNVDAVTGGFNFQAAWTSAFQVAEAVSKVKESL